MREPVYMPWYERRRRQRRLRTFAIAGTLLVLGGLLGFRFLPGGGSGAPAHASAPPLAKDAGGAGSTVHIKIEDGELTPRRLVLEQGRPIRVAVHNVGHWFHDLYVESLGIHVHLWPDDVIETKVTPTETGTFRGGCIVEGHEEHEDLVVVVR